MGSVVNQRGWDQCSCQHHLDLISSPSPQLPELPTQKPYLWHTTGTYLYRRDGGMCNNTCMGGTLGGGRGEGGWGRGDGGEGMSGSSHVMIIYE